MAVSFVPELSNVYEALAEEVEGWADALGIEVSCSDPVYEECGGYDWAADLRKQVDWPVRTAGTLLVAKGKADLSEDINRRVEELCSAATEYEQRLNAFEVQRQVRIEEIVSRYHQTCGDEDSDTAQLMQLCQGINRIWTLRIEGSVPETPEEFAEVIDRAWLKEDGAKRRALADMKRQAGEFVEYLTLVAGLEASQSGESVESGCPVQTSQVEPADKNDHTPAEKEHIGGPEEDPFDKRAVNWVGKRIYLGSDTQVSRLFWLLAQPLGRAIPLCIVQRTVDGMETNEEIGCSPEEIKKAQQRIRKVVAKLRRRMVESELDHHFLIVRGGTQESPEYMMTSRFSK